MPFFSTIPNLLQRSNIRHRAGFVWAAFCTLTLASVATGQITEFSPYSRNGLGLLSPSTTTALLGQGGSAIAAAPSLFINPENPASIAGLIKTTFEVGASGTLQQLKLGDQTGSGSFGNTAPISLVVKRQGGSMAYNLGITPFANSGFAATNTYVDDVLGSVRETYDGEGGLSQLQLGTARSFYASGWVDAGASDSLQIRKQALYLGARLRYVFGQFQRTTRLDILDITYLDSRTRTVDQHRSAGMEFGLQYELLLGAQYNAQSEFERSTSLRFGATYSPGAKLSTDRMRIVETTQTLGGIVTPLDTASFLEQNQATGLIPEQLGVGLSLIVSRGNGSDLEISADYIRQDWASAADLQTVELLTEAVHWGQRSTFRTGIAWKLANPAQRQTAWGRSTFRIGAAQGTLGLEFGEAALTYEALTAGLSMPMIGSRSSSMFHFGTEFGTRHTGEGSLQENYLRFQFGFSLSPFMKNNWLVPRLYD